MDPTIAVSSGHNALGTQDNAIRILVAKRIQLIRHGCAVEGGGGLGTAAYKDLFGVVMMVLTVMMATAALLAILMVVMMMLMIVVMAAALFIVIVVMMMLMVMIVAAALLIVIVVVMLMIVVMTAALFIVIVVVVMLMLVVVAMALLTVLMVMVMLVATALLIVIMMMVALTLLVVVMMMVVVVMRGFLSQAGQLGLQGVGALHGLQELCARQIVPGGGDDDGGGIMLAEEGDSGLDLGRGGGFGVRQNNTTCILHLIVEELTEILHIHLALPCIYHSGKAVQNCPFGGGALHGADDVGELTHARGLDEDTIRSVLSQHLRQRLTEVSYKGAADTARIHLIDLDACLRKKAAVDTDLTEFVLDKDKLLTCVGLGDELLDKGCFTGAEKAGENINFSHNGSLLYQ